MRGFSEPCYAHQYLSVFIPCPLPCVESRMDQERTPLLANMDNTKGSTTVSNVPDGKDFAVQESVESLDGNFDGTANLTVEGGTILIPAPTADPRGTSASPSCIKIMLTKRDPLNLSTRHKYFILGILTACMYFSACQPTMLLISSRCREWVMYHLSTRCLDRFYDGGLSKAGRHPRPDLHTLDLPSTILGNREPLLYAPSVSLWSTSRAAPFVDPPVLIRYSMRYE